MKKAGASDEELARRFKELERIELTRGTEYLLQLFFALSNQRLFGMNGPQPLQLEAIDVYCRRVRDLSAWEIETICLMDNAFIGETYRQA
jgi:hypothetical protein